MTKNHTDYARNDSHVKSLFEGLVLNASQAARVADVRRPVIATWASRHEDFPRALEP